MNAVAPVAPAASVASVAPAALDPIAIVEDFLAKLEAGDLDGALALLADDVVYENVPFPKARGKRATEQTLRSFLRLFDTFRVTMHNIAARDGVVLTERTDVLSGRLLHLDIWVCGTFEVRGGKITLWRDRFDLVETTAKLLTGPLRKLLGLTR
jgi:limonene-1,2-epoxide hydrolase